jgi:hypothetical protein
MEVRVFVFEIIVPGTWLNHENQDWAWETQNQLRSLQSQFFEANLALNFFIQSQQLRSFADKEAREMDWNRRSEISSIVRQERGGLGGPADWEYESLETEIRFNREKWEQGRSPREFERNVPFMYAKAFLYALDGFDKFLGVLAKTDGVPENVIRLTNAMNETFPHLRGVRNTAQHLEDRSRFLDHKKKPLDLKPVENDLISAPNGGALFLNNLNGSRYGSTMADGHFGEVDVSSESMFALQAIFQSVLDSFNWKGPKQFAPT